MRPIESIKNMFRGGSRRPAETARPSQAATPPVSGPEARVRELVAQGKPVEAMRAARELLNAAPGKPGAAGLYAWTLEHVGRHEEALEAYRAELTANPSDAAALARAADLAKALAPPRLVAIPAGQRSWHTSLPRETLLGLQRSLHQYTYRDVPLLKNPFDLALYPRLVWALKPQTIFEIGSKSGGSALWMGDLLDAYGIDGHIYSLDIVKVERVSHPRVTFLEGNGRDPAATFTPQMLAGLPRPWLVIEDADHAYETSIAVLKFFDPRLHSGEYVIVEDGIISDLTEDAAANSGPHRALKEFLAAHPGGYEIDAGYCDFFGYNLTWCTNGWLRKLGSPGSASAGAENVLLETASRPAKPAPPSPPAAQRLLNVGCGASFHPAWVNMDIAPTAPGVLKADISQGLAFEAESFDAVYHSHVLEHLTQTQAAAFVRECFRVLRPGGILRVVVPDLETIARLYLKNLEGAVEGDLASMNRHEWMTIELLDQLVREQSGGEMLRYWRQNPMPAESFVIERMGWEVKRFLEDYRRHQPSSQPQPPPQTSPAPEVLLAFRASGELHKWMYDRVSLGRLLVSSGFRDVRVCSAANSDIPGFAGYGLDLAQDGSARKPDSLFMEARKPGSRGG